MSPARPGAFAANFEPEILDSFRNRCKEEGRQYSKVLEKLAQEYVITNGAILNHREIVNMLSGDIQRLSNQIVDEGKIEEGIPEKIVDRHPIEEFYPDESITGWKMAYADLNKRLDGMSKALQKLGRITNLREPNLENQEAPF
ncbi:hypothetical protein N8561_01185 [bacterium]|nr:hypothetical protein [bacterium]